MTQDKEVLNRLKSETQLVQTQKAYIFPAGEPAAYALDERGHVVGLKFSGVTEEVLKLIPQFENLERLVIHSNSPFDLPSEIALLRHLRFLWLGGVFRSLPPEIFSMPFPPSPSLMDVLGGDAFLAVEKFERGRRKFRFKEDTQTSFKLNGDSTLDSVEKELNNVAGIFLSLQALEDPPLEIAEKGLEAIREYFANLGKGAFPLNELKVLLVGNGAAGKTSFIKRILGDDFNADEPQTHGINIRPWAIGIDNLDVKLNFWDFGGQEIMHATHQFFLSKRSVYIVVLDGRKEEDPEYWLQHIESFGGDSPIMIVLNKIDEHPSFDVNRRFLKSKYKGIIDFFRVSCATGVGLDNFTNRLRDELATVPMLQTRWPNNWFAVKRRLENLDLAYVSLNEYSEICREENVADEKNQDILLDFLNDLGVVLHFKDIELLDTQVLDPRWVTEAVYRIINSEILADQKGYLRLNQLDQALKPRSNDDLVYPVDKHRYIVDLMKKFELCYEIDGSAVLIPDLLDIQEPATDFRYNDPLRFVLEYSYLPRSIVPRFIVRMNKDIKGNMRWRTGVVVEDRSFGATALVVADQKDKKISISVGGKQKRDYFSAIRKALNDINSSFEKLGVTEYVPLPDKPEVLLDYKELLGYEVANRDEIFVGRLGKAYNVPALLNGIERRTARQMESNSLIVVEGDYYANSRVNMRDRVSSNTREVNITAGEKIDYSPHGWEKALAYLTAFLFIGVVCFLLIRNQPIADPNLVVFVRTILSVMLAVFGATIPGMLKVDLSVKGISIRAIGALALFVITFLLTPKVL